MSYKEQVLENLRGGNILLWYKSFADFCPAGKAGEKDLVAKIFVGSPEAMKEYRNLNWLYGLDERIRVPEPFELINLGWSKSLLRQGITGLIDWGFDAEHYAVIMEYLKGEKLVKLELQYLRN